MGKFQLTEEEKTWIRMALRKRGREVTMIRAVSTDVSDGVNVFFDPPAEVYGAAVDHVYYGLAALNQLIEEAQQS